MSTILNTLKKLEEEKSVLDRNLNLKGLVLQTDRVMHPRSAQERINPGRTLVALIVCGVIVGVGLGIHLNPAEKNVPSTTVQAEIPDKPVAPSAPEPVPTVQAPAVDKRDMAMGIPLASIPDETVAKPPPTLDRTPKTDSPLPAPPQSPAPAAAQSIEPASISMELLPDFHEINAIIDEAKSRKVQSSPPPAVSNYSAISIPGVKMKGIVYFSEKNPANYILISGSQGANQKLKTGETVQNATLMEVLPASAIFSYNGKLTNIRIGE